MAAERAEQHTGYAAKDAQPAPALTLDVSEALAFAMPLAEAEAAAEKAAAEEQAAAQVQP